MFINISDRQKKEKVRKTKNSVRDLWDAVKQPNIHGSEVLETMERQNTLEHLVKY